jgi:hypothetical protein
MMDEYSGVELCMPIWLNHNHGDARVVDVSAVDTYSGVEVCTLIFLIRKSFSKNLQNKKWTHPLTKLNTNKSCYVDNIWLW